MMMLQEDSLILVQEGLAEPTHQIQAVEHHLTLASLLVQEDIHIHAQEVVVGPTQQIRTVHKINGVLAPLVLALVIVVTLVIMDVRQIFVIRQEMLIDVLVVLVVAMTLVIMIRHLLHQVNIVLVVMKLLVLAGPQHVQNLILAMALVEQEQTAVCGGITQLAANIATGLEPVRAVLVHLLNTI
jgi:hypothetical protein